MRFIFVSANKPCGYQSHFEVVYFCLNAPSAFELRSIQIKNKKSNRMTS